MPTKLQRQIMGFWKKGTITDVTEDLHGQIGFSGYEIIWVGLI